MFGALIVAAGKGKRMENDTPKQFLMLKDKHVIAHTVGIFSKMKDFFNKIVLVVPPGSNDFCRDIFSGILKNDDFLVVVEGGKERQDSVYKGLLMMTADEIEVISIHDGARPLVSASLVKDISLKAMEYGAVIPVVDIKDTVKEVNNNGEVVKTLLREKFRLVQTPQSFRKEIIMEAFNKARAEGFHGTDDASLVERAGYRVLAVPGEEANIKLTTPEDFTMAEIFLERGGKDLQSG